MTDGVVEVGVAVAVGSCEVGLAVAVGSCEVGLAVADGWSEDGLAVAAGLCEVGLVDGASDLWVALGAAGAPGWWSPVAGDAWESSRPPPGLDGWWESP
ncbi:hypothetical protein FH608_033670 [Nonomuraea phyllanthi]|uniref:Uncharacterized protein n=1 Tax=Nonomuraea phyllanthi TaxID=2219224 RepID=A0A5C4W071_9ACTN|nr:hypothetical protein [Nonomuraea phyllanthi]KAB8190989.1 hypothetical protein FH608_033670 [Nonomuraea phyllanthi]